jgi:hypothetical protein
MYYTETVQEMKPAPALRIRQIKALGTQKATSAFGQCKSKCRTSTPSTGFETAIPTIEMLQTCALERKATGIGYCLYSYMSKLEDSTDN